MSRLVERVGNIFLLKNRLAEYREILAAALEHGYQVLPVIDYYNLLQDNKLSSSTPYLILRHDIDSDPEAALLFAGIEHSFDLRATYYYRLSTWDARVIEQISALGNETGYHYQEVADFIVRHGVRDLSLVTKYLPVIQQMFITHLSRLRNSSGLPLRGVASHGDVVNYRLNIGNQILLEDKAFRAEHAILYEAYDSQLVESYQLHISDYLMPTGFLPCHPKDIIRQRQTFCLLTHPRHWRRNIPATLQEELGSWLRSQHIRAAQRNADAD